MGRKIFISYKYADDNVQALTMYNWPKTTVRDYVDKLQELLELTNNQNKGEQDNEDLSDLTDDAIWERLKDRIYDSSVTIVMISPNMKESGKLDRSQWIPWEVSYSLKEMTRNDETSHSNAILAVVLPDQTGSYKYFIEDNICCSPSCRTLKTDTLFDILKNNMFNRKLQDSKKCAVVGNTVHYGESCYIHSVKWMDFINNPQSFIEKSMDLQGKIDEYEICKEV